MNVRRIKVPTPKAWLVDIYFFKELNFSCKKLKKMVALVLYTKKKLKKMVALVVFIEKIYFTCFLT